MVRFTLTLVLYFMAAGPGIGCGTPKAGGVDSSSAPKRADSEAGDTEETAHAKGPSDIRTFCPKEAIEVPMWRHVRDFQVCYEKALTAHPSLEGRVDAIFSVGKDGRAFEVSTQGLPTVGACIADVIRSVEFPWRHGCDRVRWPFVFSKDERSN